MGGAFYVAVRAQAPVVPITLVGTYDVVPMNSFHVRPGRVQLIVGEPISTVGMKARDMDKVAKQARDIIEQTYYAHACVGQPLVVEQNNGVVTGNEAGVSQPAATLEKPDPSEAEASS
jgi:1-acyl-sn-glycerol-3-phosphate acyltransferase